MQIYKLLHEYPVLILKCISEELPARQNSHEEFRSEFYPVEDKENVTECPVSKNPLDWISDWFDLDAVLSRRRCCRCEERVYRTWHRAGSREGVQGVSTPSFPIGVV